MRRVCVSVARRGYATTEFSKHSFLKELGLSEVNAGVYDGQWFGSGAKFASVNPTTGNVIAHVTGGTPADYARVVKSIRAAQPVWAAMPAPRRGEIVRQVGNALREVLEPLGKLVSLEVGKSKVEGVGEVQEYVDVCDFAVGLSRTLQGQLLPSERPNHVLLERYHPLGCIGVITAFNFPNAVFGWNSALAMITGNATLWKGAPSTPLTTVATTRVVASVLERNKLPGALASCIVADADIGKLMADDPHMHAISFTGSTAVGREVGLAVAKRFGTPILELGGNNAAIVHSDADLDLAVRSAFFGAVGTAGQRCTTTRRLLVHESVFEDVVSRLKKAYAKVTVGDPLDTKVLMGPLKTRKQVEQFEAGVKQAVADGGKVLFGGKVLKHALGGNFVEPTLIALPDHTSRVLMHELFVPVMYVVPYSTLDQAIAYNNSVPQGLSSTLFTRDQRNVFKWISAAGSDCGLVNVNTSTSGAEIGGAFGGNKETGNGRESGSDAWKQYCRRMTCTINHGDELPLAQGITFG